MGRVRERGVGRVRERGVRERGVGRVRERGIGLHQTICTWSRAGERVWLTGPAPPASD